MLGLQGMVLSAIVRPGPALKQDLFFMSWGQLRPNQKYVLLLRLP